LIDSPLVHPLKIILGLLEEAEIEAQRNPLCHRSIALAYRSVFWICANALAETQLANRQVNQSVPLLRKEQMI
jgi:hypothetical protein